MVHRRRLLALAGGAAVLGLAGCAEQESEFLVTQTRLVHREGDRDYDYPQDVLYEVSIENTGPQRQEGRIEITLFYEPESGERESWSKTDSISLSRGTSVQEQYVFENVFDLNRDIEDYRLDAEIVQDEQ